MLIWLVVASILFFFNLLQYFLLKKRIKENCTYTRKETVPFLFLKRKIFIYTSHIPCTPFSTGLFHPVIVLPDNLSSNEESLVLLHEKLHIQQLDFLINFLSILIRSVHWFNPLVYILPNNIKINQEYVIDMLIMRKLDDRQKYKYGQLILDSSNWNTSISRYGKYTSSLNDKEFNILRERIIRIKNIMKNKKNKSTLVILAIIVTLIINMFPILTYSAPIKITGSISSNGEMFSFTPNSVTDNIVSPTFNISEIYFETNTGERFPIMEKNLINNTRRSCNHKWVNGTLQKHVPHSDRSCDVMVYNAKRCSICGYTVVSDLINVIHYKVCPH